MEYHLQLPVSKKEMKKLHIGDILYLSGTIFTARDAAHRLLLQKDIRKLPFDPSKMALYHCGPLMKKQGNTWIAVSAGPTTSSRIDVFEDKFIEKFQIPLIIGKGGMGKKTAHALQRHSAVYTVFPGGAGVVAAEKIQKVEKVYWLEQLGMLEAVWILKMKDFGPLVVTLDAHGGSLVEHKIPMNKTDLIKIC